MTIWHNFVEILFCIEQCVRPWREMLLIILNFLSFREEKVLVLIAFRVYFFNLSQKHESKSSWRMTPYTIVFLLPLPPALRRVSRSEFFTQIMDIYLLLKRKKGGGYFPPLSVVIPLSVQHLGCNPLLFVRLRRP